MGQTGPVDELIALDRSAQVWRDALALLPQDLSAPSYLPEWSLATVVNHVHGGGVRYRLYVEGGPGGEVTQSRSADWCSPSPDAVFDQTQVALRAAFVAHLGRPEPVPHPAGAMPVAALLRLRCLELTVHAWDIAKSVDLTGVETCPMPSDLADWLSREMAEGLRGLSTQGYFAAPPGSHSDDPRAELLRLCGRS